MEKWAMEDLASKIDYEGGLEEALWYFGREVESDDVDVNAAWRVAYDAVMALHDLLEERGGVL